MKEQVYKDPRPAEYFQRFYDRTRTRKPDWMYEVVRLVLTPYLLILHRARAIGSEQVPTSGPAIIAPNHFSFLDHFFVAVYLRRKVHFMAKSQLFTRPLQFIYTHGGVFPVRRGLRDEQSFEVAKTVLGRGGLVVMYPEAGRSRTGELTQPRPGLGRLALETGVPVVPTAIVGSEKARNWKRLQFAPKVTVQYGRAVQFEQVVEPTREQSQAAAEIVFERVKELHTELRSNGRRWAVQAARAARRAAKDAAGATGRRPAAQ